MRMRVTGALVTALLSSAAPDGATESYPDTGTVTLSNGLVCKSLNPVDGENLY